METFLPTFGAVAVAVITAIFGVLSYQNQKRIDRQVDLRNRRMKAYEAFLDAYREWIRKEDTDEAPQAQNTYWSAYSSLFQIASDRVLLAVTEFHRLQWKNPDSLTGKDWDREFKKLYARMIIEMRRDAFEKTELPTEVVEERLPFSLD